MPSEYTTLFTSVQMGASTGLENVIKLKRILRKAAKMTEEYWKLIMMENEKIFHLSQLWKWRNKNTRIYPKARYAPAQRTGSHAESSWKMWAQKIEGHPWLLDVSPVRLHGVKDSSRADTAQDWRELPRSGKPGCKSRVLQTWLLLPVESKKSWASLLTYLGNRNNIIHITGWELTDVAWGSAHTKCWVYGAVRADTQWHCYHCLGHEKTAVQRAWQATALEILHSSYWVPIQEPNMYYLSTKN